MKNFTIALLSFSGFFFLLKNAPAPTEVPTTQNRLFKIETVKPTKMAWAIQLACFNDYGNAMSLLTDLEDELTFMELYIGTDTDKRGITQYKVILGTFSDKKGAENYLGNLAKLRAVRHRSLKPMSMELKEYMAPAAKK